jgi:predicted dehydrogenase
MCETAVAWETLHMNRRNFLLSAAVAAGPLGAAPKRYRAAVIGHTGRGNYGHGLDTVWKAHPEFDVCAVADPDDAGRAEAVERIGAKKAYRDYREMLDKEKPDFVSVGPRFLDQRAEMVIAAAEAGAHIFCEKPFARSCEEADRMIAAIDKAGVKLQLAHQMRQSPYTKAVREMVRSGEIGEIQEIRGRGKEDRRAGGEDLMVLGSHICDVMRIMLGDPKWVFAHVTQNGAEMGRADVHQAGEPLGPIAGNQISAMFAFDNGVHAYFGSKACEVTHGLRFGVHIYGTKAVVFLPNAIYPSGGQPYILRTPSWAPSEGAKWEQIPVPDVTRPGADDRQLANLFLVEDLLEAIKQDREPSCGPRDGRWTVEMITGIYRSQIERRPVDLPMKDRRHPLEAWS